MVGGEWENEVILSIFFLFPKVGGTEEEKDTLIPAFEKDGQDCDGQLLHVWNPEEEWKQDFGQIL